MEILGVIFWILVIYAIVRIFFIKGNPKNKKQWIKNIDNEIANENIDYIPTDIERAFTKKWEGFILEKLDEISDATFEKGFFMNKKYSIKKQIESSGVEWHRDFMILVQVHILLLN